MAQYCQKDAYKIVKVLMTITGCWPKRNPGLFYKIRGLFLSFLIQISVLSLTLIKIYFDWGDMVTVSQDLCMTLSFVSFGLKRINFYWNREAFLQILDSLDEPVFDAYKGDLYVHLKKLVENFTSVTNMFLLFSAGSVLGFGLFPVVDPNPVQRFPVPTPFGLDESGYIYYLTYGYEALSVILLGWNSACLDLIPSSLMVIACGQLKVLQENLKLPPILERNLHTGMVSYGGSRKNKLDEVILSSVNSCVQHHVAIIRLLDSIHNVFSLGFLSQILVSIIIICILEFNFIIVPPVSTQFIVLICYFITMALEMVFYCFCGDAVILESMLVNQACYDSDWINYGSEAKRSLFLIMERSKKPLYVTGGKLIILSLSSFTTLAKTSFSYFAVLRNMYKNN